jgi:hypothetical protein
LSCLWFIGWCVFGFSSPEDHPRISKEERLFLKKNTAAHARKVSLENHMNYLFSFYLRISKHLG